MPQNGPPGKTETAQSVEDGPFEAAHGREGRVGMQRVHIARSQPVEQGLVVAGLVVMNGNGRSVRQGRCCRRWSAITAETANAANEERHPVVSQFSALLIVSVHVEQHQRAGALVVDIGDARLVGDRGLRRQRPPDFQILLAVEQ